MKAVYLKQGNNKVVSVPYYRVGDLFLTTIATNPSNYLGGTWELYGPGRVLVCVNTSDSVLNASKKTGGSTNPLTSHRHSRIMNDNNIIRAAGWGTGTTHTGTLNEMTDNAWEFLGTNYAGDNTNHNNWQPFITCYVWIRTA